MRELEVRSNGYNLQEGWQIAAISYAEFGQWNVVKYIDVYFEGLPETLNLRIYETVNSQTGKEFAIGNLFRFANAGIVEVQTNGDSKHVRINDDPTVLSGKKLNIFLYREGSRYFRILSRVAPAEWFENELEIMSPDSIEYWKYRAEWYYKQYVELREPVETESTPF